MCLDICCFDSLEDPRTGNRTVHSLDNIIFITLSGILCGMTSFAHIAEFGESKIEFFRKHLDIPYGIPSHDTFGDVFKILDPKQFAECFENWTDSIRKKVDGDIVAFDGKTVRASFNRSKGQLPLHLMNVWSCKNKICLAQTRCDVKSNEIQALEYFLEKLDLDKCTVTADAMHCHKKTTKLITDAGADYVLGLKGNEKKLYEYCGEQFSAYESRCESYGFVEKKHGRFDSRTVDFIQIAEKNNKALNGWFNLNSFLRIKSSRTIHGVTKEEVRYYITSLSDNKRAYEASRYHWQIENNCHWVLDNIFKEDRCTVREQNGGENFAHIRKFALNLIGRIKTQKTPYWKIMFRALMYDEVLISLLQEL
jgi:predicted transposase YbfD/YdcC